MRMPTPPNPRMTMATRMKVASMSRYSPSPPHTPPMTRLVRLRSRRPDTDRLPSIAALVERREDDCCEGRGRDRWIGGQRGQWREPLGQHGDGRQAEGEQTARI